MEQVREYLKRLHLSASVGSQALEYYRLCEVKCPRTFNPSCLAVICIELSCAKLRVLLDKVKFFLITICLCVGNWSFMHLVLDEV